MNAANPGSDSPRGGPPATADQVRRLILRFRLEVGLTNAAGGTVLVLGALLFDPPARQETSALGGATWVVLVVVPAWVAGIWASNRIVRPLVGWLRTGEAGRPAPDEVQRLLLAYPAIQALILLALWLLTALGLALADAIISAEEPLREFLTTLAGVSIAGIVVSTLSFLSAQRIAGPWYRHFFAGADPTRHRVPSTRVDKRLLVVFSLGTAVPLLLVGAVVSERLADPEGVGQLEGIVWFLVVVGLGAGFYLTLSVRHTITRPLALIRAASESVRRGDLSVSVPAESPDEFGELAIAFNAMVEGLRERQRVQDLLGRQVGDSVADKVLDEGVSFEVERRTVTVLFLDLVGFSRLAEELPPEEVVDTLNRVFAVVIREIDARHGLVNKFMGDAVLALFGAPLDDVDHATHATDAARAIASGLDAEGVDFGIGVSTGNVVAGNVGAARRFEYTVVGDAVNEAARLQELTREHDATVLLSGRTVAALGRHDGVTPVGSVQLRGRSSSTEVFALR